MSKKNRKDYSLCILTTYAEVEKIFGPTKDFYEKSIELLENETFDHTHFIVSPCGAKRESVWTLKGINHLKNIFFISLEQESEFIQHYYCLSEALGSSSMLYSLIVERHNLSFPTVLINEKKVSRYFNTGYAEFYKKGKEELLIYLDIMKNIKKEIKAQTLRIDRPYAKQINCEEYMI